MGIWRIAPLVFLAACGSDALSGATDGGVGPRASGCPDTAPSQDGGCDDDGLLCEYGEAYNPLCNTTFVCSSGKWAMPITFGGDRSNCPGMPPSSPPNPADCPSSESAVPQGQACSTQSTCSYDGAQCSCSAFCPSFPVAEAPCNPDMGITTNCCDTSKVVWHCFDGPAPCPTPRPRIGTSCTAGAECALEPPTECGQTRMSCQDGVWKVENDACPVSTRTAKRDVAYLDVGGVEALRRALLEVRLATYRYKTGDGATHLGFVIEDMPPGSPAVRPTRDRVDLYGYVSMAVATLQRQEAEIAALKEEVRALKKRRR